MTNPISAEQTGIFRDQNLFHIQMAGHAGGMQASGTSEGHQHIVRRCIPPGYRYLPYSPGHDLVGDIQKAVQHFFFRRSFPCPLPYSVQQDHESFPGLFRKHGYSKLRNIQPSKQKVHIGNCQGPTGSITSRARKSTCTFRSHLQTVPVKRTYRTPAGCYRLDGQRGGHDMHAPYLKLVTIVIFSVNTGHICAGTSHIKSNHLVITGLFPFHRSPHDAPCRTAQEAVFRLKTVCTHQSA